ncbi:hypothetical protein NA56DRAFT_707522 [Hyaloscypha hepaticicola]|uniref:Uncharacterized protein n=1 Tax=Hyaloscypha hepaticicola TaxID=2082293 RepID=A0A2J6PUS0_9HELO|nr:hypothetical protein NA56DRAFT_707522 [Hyaloscypha hepaticicola]
MKNLSKRILVQILKSNSLPKDMDFGSMDLEDIRILIRMLSTKTPLLEAILRKLWSIRTLTAWEEPIIVPLGELLCEVLFAAKYMREAIDLAEDIYYNLNDFYGCLYPGTLNMAALLSSFYTAIGKPGDAIPLHRDVLLHITTPGLDAGSQDVARVAFDHARLLKLACQRSAATDGAAQIQLTAIEQAVAACMTLPGGRAGDWSELGPVAEWENEPTAGGSAIPQKSAYGFWERPDEWTFGRLGE